MMYEDAKKLSRHDFCQKYGQDKEGFFDKVHGELIRQILKESIESIRKDKKKERDMSRVSDMLIGMQEEAPYFPSSVSMDGLTSISGMKHMKKIITN